MLFAQYVIYPFEIITYYILGPMYQNIISTLNIYFRLKNL